MANSYTEASFLVPCTAEQAQVAYGALNAIIDGDNEFLIEALNSDSPASEAGKIIQHCVQNHPDVTEGEFYLEDLREWHFSFDFHEDGFAIFHEENINTEQAAIFVQAFLKAFDLASLIVIEAAHTCDKPRIGEFGGHTVVVTKDFIRWDSSTPFIRSEQEANEAQVRYFFCAITDINGEYEYADNFLMKCRASEDPDACLRQIFLERRDNGALEGENFVWYGDLAAKNPTKHEVTPYEYKILSKYLVTL